MPNDIKKEEKSIFGTSEQKIAAQPRKSPYDSALSSFNEQINTLIRSIRVSEERYSNLRKKTQITDQNMIEDVKKISTGIKLVDSELSDMKKQLLDVNEKISLIFEQLKGSVKKEEIKVLSKYIDIWDPMRFVTFDEAKKIIKENK